LDDTNKLNTPKALMTMHAMVTASRGAAAMVSGVCHAYASILAALSELTA
jgi:hypothetical protein